jgi:hypothetical protein
MMARTEVSAPLPMFQDDVATARPGKQGEVYGVGRVEHVYVVAGCFPVTVDRNGRSVLDGLEQTGDDVVAVLVVERSGAAGNVGEP